MTRNFLNISDIKKNDLKKILRRGMFLKRNRTSTKKIKSLDNINLAMIFEKPSTRTRVSFELAIKELGGRSVILDSTNMHISRGETIADTARVLSRYCQIMMIRTKNHNKLLEYHINSNLPVINGLSDFSHPCQVLADVMTFEEKKGSIKGAKVAWVGDGNNVTNSAIEAAVQFDFAINICVPQDYLPSKKVLDWAQSQNGKVKIFHDVKDGVKGVDCIMSDKWISMGDDGDVKKKKKDLKSFQVNDELLSIANQDVVYLHVLPAAREEEVTSSVMDGPQSLVWLQAENRLHGQKAIIDWCLSS